MKTMNGKNIFGKKILALVTALVMLLTLTPVTVSAGGGAEGGEPALPYAALPGR